MKHNRVSLDDMARLANSFELLKNKMNRVWGGAGEEGTNSPFAVNRP